VSPTFSFRPPVEALVPYEPGKPVEEVQRELGLERVVKLASNEGPFGPFPGALEAIARCAGELNRYPDGGAYRLRAALAERHGVPFEQVAVGAGADGVIDSLLQAALGPGDELVIGWPSFPSYVIDALKMGATPVRVPLAGHRFDLAALLEAVTPRTRIVAICNPNNPTGTMVGRAGLAEYFANVPEHVLTVLDEAYFEYIDDPDYPDGIDEHVKAGRRVLVLRTFSKIYGLAGLRVGYGVGPADIVTGVNKLKRAFDVATSAQEAALASLGDLAEVERRRRVNSEQRATVERILGEHGFEPAPHAVANFLYVDTGRDAGEVFQELLRLGVIVRPLGGFGAPEAIRVTVGAPEENEFLAAALGRLVPVS
jgi:histidinol-phosphate aminotransferase